MDYIDESEALTIADTEHHINKHKFVIPFVCGCRDLGEGLRRVMEGAAMLRTKGGDSLAETVRQCRSLLREVKRLAALDHNELFEAETVSHGAMKVLINALTGGREMMNTAFHH